ncbi:MAG: hydroxyisourate hydrolase [Candidatus Sericytochromatia bacterium]|nr:hydroxyisourate hydrolase [Candidatus Sericytochromatia bacterium]
MSPITTHVLDTSSGRPAAGVPISLAKLGSDGTWQELANGITDDDGRIKDLLPSDHPLATGIYRMTFATETYFASQAVKGFYPMVPVIFDLQSPATHYHIPLLLSPFGYSTYRGS